MITAIEDYFSKGCGRCERFDTAECSTRQWEEGLAALRRICRDLGLRETVKWGHPCYMHAERNIAIIGALRGEFRLSFFHAALLRDPDGVLEEQGPNARHPDMFRFASNEEVGERAAVIRGYLAEAMGYAEAGVKAPKEPIELELPDVLVQRERVTRTGQILSSAQISCGLLAVPEQNWRWNEVEPPRRVWRSGGAPAHSQDGPREDIGTRPRCHQQPALSRAARQRGQAARRADSAAGVSSPRVWRSASLGSLCTQASG